MPQLLPRSLHGLPTSADNHEGEYDDDVRVECSLSSLPQPLTADARIGEQRQSLLSGLLSPQLQPPPPASPLSSSATNSSAMPPIFPAPERTSQPKRRTFLPQLGQAKTLAMAQSPSSTPSTAHDLPDGMAEDEDTDAFKQAMWAGQANILVTVRVRPHCGHDRDDREIVKVLDHKLIVVLDKQQQLQHHQQASASASSPQHRQLPVTLARRSSGGTTSHHGLRKLRNVASAHPARVPVASNQTQTAATSHSHRSREKRYAFDYVFTPHDSQITVYHHTTKFLIHGVLNGFNATVFAYGCTGAGKTYTMLGTKDEPGIMALTLDDLFQNISKVHADPQATVEYKVTVSFLEVYNENIRDLLVTPSPQFGYQGVNGSSSFSPSSYASTSSMNGSSISVSGSAATGSAAMMATPSSSEYLDLREDPVKGPVVAGISEVEASNAREVMKLLRRGNKHRSQEATAANAVSSRSHAVLQVLVEQREKPSSSGDAFGVDATRGGVMSSSVKYGKLSLVDLAGSERAAVTQNRGQRLIEGANINRSLLALGNCINALGEKGATGTAFVPYRDSKLTRLLKDSLGGNCRTVMIANVSPASASVEETLNTLKYANRAKNIKTTVTRNVLSVDHHLTEYASVVAELKTEIATLRAQLARQAEPSVTKVSPGRRDLGGRRKERARRDRTGSNNEQEDDDDEEDDESENHGGWRQSKFHEARGYIAQCFQQRQQLRQGLVELDFGIAELSKCLVSAVATATETDAPDGDDPATLLHSHGHEPQRGSDLAAVVLEDFVEDSQQQQLQQERDVDVDTDAPEMTLHGTQRVEAGLRHLLSRKTQLVAQLARNQSIMDEFRHGIEQSVSVGSNATLRDLLLMEYRVGDLQVENSVLQTQLKLRGVAGSGIKPVALFDGNVVPSLELPASCTEMVRRLSARTSPSQKTTTTQHTAHATSKTANEETPELHSNSTRSRTGFAFLDDLRDRFYDHRVKTTKSPERQQSSSPTGKATTTGTSTTTTTTTTTTTVAPRNTKSSSSTTTSAATTATATTGGAQSPPRRQWGIHLNNATLPYIRLKKKTPAVAVPPVPSRASALAGSVAPTSISSRDYATSLTSTISMTRVSESGSATAAAPYLKVLKHRNPRKLTQQQQHHHRNGNGSSSHKKLPVLSSSS